MISITRADVPEYLKRGLLCTALHADENEPFEIPARCFKKEESVSSVNDMLLILRSLHFWQAEQLPIPAVEFLMNYGKDDFSAEVPQLRQVLLGILAIKEATLQDRIVIAIRAKQGLPLVRWIINNFSYSLTSSACSVAAEVGDIDTLIYLHENGCPWDARTIRSAIQSGSIPCVSYAESEHCPPLRSSERRLNYAALGGSIEMIKYMRGTGEEWSISTMSNGARSGSVSCMKYLRKMGCPWGKFVCMGAAAGGNLECLKYARRYGCPWDDHTTVMAALNGNIVCLKYAHEHGCQWGAGVTLAAAQAGHVDCLKYALNNGCAHHYRATYRAMCGGHWQCVCCAVKFGADLNCVSVSCLLLAAYVLSTGCLLCFAVLVNYGDCDALWKAFACLWFSVILCGAITLVQVHGMATQLGEFVAVADATRVRYSAYVVAVFGLVNALLFYFYLDGMDCEA